MKNRKMVFCLLGVGFLILGFYPVSSAEVQPSAEYVPGEVIVKFKSETDSGIPEGRRAATGAEVQSPVPSVQMLHNKHGLKKMERLSPRRAPVSPMPPGKDSKLRARLERRQRRATRGGPEKGRKLQEGFSRICKLAFDQKADITRIIADYQDDPHVEYAQPNYTYHTDLTPDDPLFPLQWPLHNTGQDYPYSGYYNTPPGTPDCDIDAPEAWDIETGGEVIVAVLDTGVDYFHPDLENNMWINENEIPNNGIDDDNNGYVDDVHGYNFIYHIPHPSDDHGHGTHCAGIIAAEGDNEISIAGVCWSAKIMALKFIDRWGRGDTWLAVAGINYAAEMGADIISNSWGGPAGGKFDDPTLRDAVDYAFSQGVIVVAAAGNDNEDALHYPSDFQHALSVAATDSNDIRAPFSCYGDRVHISAPGVDILSSKANNVFPGVGTEYDYFTTICSGTSMSCPHVAGLAALLLCQDPTRSISDVVGRLVPSADDIDALNPGYENQLGSGRINAYEALNSEPAAYLKFDYDSFDKHQWLQRRVTSYIIVPVENWGADAENVVITLSSPNAYVDIISDTSNLGEIDVLGLAYNNNCPFVVYLQDELPEEETTISFSLQITADNAATSVWDFSLGVAEERMTFAWSSLLGGIEDDAGNCIVVDSTGSVYVAGSTRSPGFPTVAGAFDETHNGGSDVFVCKLNSAGTDLEYATFLGGSSGEGAGDIAIDSSGCIYLSGTTFSSDFPTTPGVFDESANGGADAFVSKLNSTGDTLLYSTFLGGSNDDYGGGVVVDSSGCAYVKGLYTYSPDFPITLGAFDKSFNGERDGFVTKLNPTGSGLEYSTFLGGSDTDACNGIVLDPVGGVYVAGYTRSLDFPATSGALSESHNGGFIDAFVAKLNFTGAGLEYSTFLGGNHDDHINEITIGPSGSVFVVGHTGSSDFPTTSGAFDESDDGDWDVFVSKLNSDLSSLVYSTRLGGDGEYGHGIAVDCDGCAFVTGYTNSPDFPTTPGAFDPTFNGEQDISTGWDVFVTKLNSTGTDLCCSTFLGGGDRDFSANIVLDSSGSAYVTGDTRSFDFPTTSGSFDSTHNGEKDAFVVKLTRQIPVANAVSGQAAYVSEAVSFDGSESSDPDGDALTYTWEFGDSIIGSGVTATHIYTAAGVYTVTLTIDDGVYRHRYTFQVEVLAEGQPRADAGQDRQTFVNRLVTLDGSGSSDPEEEPLSYAWELGEGSTAWGVTATHIYMAEGVYTVTLTVSDGGLSDDDVCIVNVLNHWPVAYAGPDQVVNVNDVVVLDGSGSYDADSEPLTYSWEFGDGSTGLGVAGTHSYDVGIYIVTLTVADGENSDSDTCEVRVFPEGQPNAGGMALAWSTLLGGSGEDKCESIAVDSVGAVYIVGSTHSMDFPTTSGFFGETYNGEKDVFITKLNPAGRELDYSAFLGGGQNEEGYGVAVDSTGSAYVSGYTQSSGFPTVFGSFDEYYNGGKDAFVVKVNPDGASLDYSGFLGGSGDEYARSIDLDSSGAAYVTGHTDSSAYPTTTGAFDELPGGNDAFVTKLNLAGSGLDYSSCLGTGKGRAIRVDSSGSAYVLGHTDSSGFPSTTGAFDESHNGSYDVFVAKINPGGTDLDYSTFIGGTNQDYPGGLALDSQGCVYISGHTNSSDLPVFSGAFDELSNGGWDVFVAKLDSEGAVLEYATFLGGASSETAYAAAVDSSGCAFASGVTYSAEFPTTSDAIDRTSNQGVFVTKLGFFGGDLEYSTFLSGAGEDYGMALAIDSFGSVYVAGHTDSGGFPTTSGAFDESHNGNKDVFVAKLTPEIAISGILAFEYPGWVDTNYVRIDYQVRTPSLPPAAPLHEGTLTVCLAPGNPATGNYGIIDNIPDGSYDVALKHANHFADLKTVVVSGGEATGIDFTLWAGDADGDGLYNAYPTDPTGDNDVDLIDYYTLFYQYQGGLPLTTGYNADFDGDGDIDLDDYYGLFYGYHNARNPGNWYFP